MCLFGKYLLTLGRSGGRAAAQAERHGISPVDVYSRRSECTIISPKEDSPTLAVPDSLQCDRFVHAFPAAPGELRAPQQRVITPRQARISLLRKELSAGNLLSDE